MVDLDDLIAEPLVGRDVDLEFAGPGLDLSCLGYQPVVGREACLALGLASLGCHTDPFQLSFDGPLSSRVDLLFSR